MSSSEVICSIFFSGDELLRVEELSISSSSDFINDSWFEIEEDGSWYVFSSSSLGEECVECIITTTDSFIRWHLSVRLNTVFKTEEFPAGITNLDTSLTNVNGDNLPHAFFLFKLKLYNLNFKCISTNDFQFKFLLYFIL